MIDAIVYNSNSGFTKEYSSLLSKKINIPAYSLKEAKKNINKNSEIIYMSWIMAGSIKKYRKANRLYKIKVICAVGMSEPSNKVFDELAKRNKVEKNRLFYIQGGLDISKLSGIYKKIMNMIKKKAIEEIDKKEEKTKEDEITYKMYTEGISYVNEKKLIPIVEYINDNKLI